MEVPILEGLKKSGILLKKVDVLIFSSMWTHEIISPPEFVLLDLVFCVMFCRSFFVLFLLDIVLYVLLLFTASGYPYGFLKLFWSHLYVSKAFHILFHILSCNHYACRTMRDQNSNLIFVTSSNLTAQYTFLEQT